MHRLTDFSLAFLCFALCDVLNCGFFATSSLIRSFLGSVRRMSGGKPASGKAPVSGPSFEAFSLIDQINGIRFLSLRQYALRLLTRGGCPKVCPVLMCFERGPLAVCGNDSLCCAFSDTDVNDPERQSFLRCRLHSTWKGVSPGSAFVQVISPTNDAFVFSKTASYHCAAAVTAVSQMLEDIGPRPDRVARCSAMLSETGVDHEALRLSAKEKTLRMAVLC